MHVRRRLKIIYLSCWRVLSSRRPLFTSELTGDILDIRVDSFIQHGSHLIKMILK
jgi:hypothetical protein